MLASKAPPERNRRQEVARLFMALRVKRQASRSSAAPPARAGKRML